MKRLVSTLNLPKEDWLRYRKCGITGTDAGAILGLNPYRSAFQVYHDKISDTIENIDNEAMRQGRDLEDYVAQRFSEETGFKVRRANAIYQSEEHPLLLADFDRLIVGQKAGLECKTVSPFSADKWADGKIPAHYLAQVDHYLAVSGFDCWYVAALIFGRELVIHKIVTDDAAKTVTTQPKSGIRKVRDIVLWILTVVMVLSVVVAVISGMGVMSVAYIIAAVVLCPKFKPEMGFWKRILIMFGAWIAVSVVLAIL